MSTTYQRNQIRLSAITGSIADIASEGGQLDAKPVSEVSAGS